MNIDELKKYIPNNRQDLRDSWQIYVINNWKNNDFDIDTLEEIMNKWYGNVWIGNNSEHEIFYNAMSKFIHEKIRKIGGMTMNERLYEFGLLDEFDRSQNKESFYLKLKCNK
jgi:hypothetical protein